MKDKPLPFPAGTRKHAKVKPPPRPDWLHPEAVAEWDRLAPTMAQSGWLDLATVEGFAETVQLGCEAHRLNKLVDEMGLEKATASGIYAALLDTQRLLLEYLGEFFMTPKSRRELGVDYQPAPGA